MFEPSDQGSPVFEPFSDVYAREVQQYLFDFCNHIDEWALTPQSEASLEINPCSMYVFKSWMEHECTETGENGEGDYLAALPARNNCCGYTDNNFPYDANEFSMCIRDWATYWGGQHEYNHGLWFDGEGTLKVIVMEGSSTEKYSEIFDVTDAYFKNLLAFFDSRDPPPAGLGMTGFATTALRFYALQKAIVEGLSTTIANYQRANEIIELLKLRNKSALISFLHFTTLT